MKHIKSIELIFENLDSFNIDQKYIGDFFLGECETQIKRNAVNTISRMEFANIVFFEIFKNGNEQYNEFDSGDLIYNFDRILEYNDISSILIEYDDDTSESFFVDYSPENDEFGMPNIKQFSVVSDFGHLYCLIADKEKYKNELEELGINSALNSMNDEKDIKFRERLFGFS